MALDSTATGIRVTCHATMYGGLPFDTPADDGCLTWFYVASVHTVAMSSHPIQTTGVESWTPSCTFCECRLTEELLAIQSYPSETTSLPAGVPEYGGLTLCPDCASEVTELLTCWDHHGQPPVCEQSTIGDGYRNVTSTCSFCTESFGKAVLGVELYRRAGDELPAYANYTLCENCQSVFGEFLQNVRAAAER
jgi:hypothetical protein